MKWEQGVGGPPQGRSRGQWEVRIRAECSWLGLGVRAADWRFVQKKLVGILGVGIEWCRRGVFDYLRPWERKRGSSWIDKRPGNRQKNLSLPQARSSNPTTHPTTKSKASSTRWSFSTLPLFPKAKCQLKKRSVSLF